MDKRPEPPVDDDDPFTLAVEVTPEKLDLQKPVREIVPPPSSEEPASKPPDP